MSGMEKAEVSCVGRTSLWMYYLAVAAIILGVILAILYIFCCNNQRLKTWTDFAFLFAIALGVAALYQGGYDEMMARMAKEKAAAAGVL